mmetsp:Transcript_30708/g.64361  ORF Transcript_30708/g.64361 Transcript_30708/m.64361 type:complete len:310 (+) Transcript_30708:95-1024(+)
MNNNKHTMTPEKDLNSQVDEDGSNTESTHNPQATQMMTSGLPTTATADDNDDDVVLSPMNPFDSPISSPTMMDDEIVKAPLEVLEGRGNNKTNKINNDNNDINGNNDKDGRHPELLQRKMASSITPITSISVRDTVLPMNPFDSPGDSCSSSGDDDDDDFRALSKSRRCLDDIFQNSHVKSVGGAGEGRTTRSSDGIFQNEDDDDDDIDHSQSTNEENKSLQQKTSMLQQHDKRQHNGVSSRKPSGRSSFEGNRKGEIEMKNQFLKIHNDDNDDDESTIWELDHEPPSIIPSCACYAVDVLMQSSRYTA